MEYLRQIEDDIRTVTTEGAKKYSEVGHAGQAALSELKLIRESYVKSVRGDGREKNGQIFRASSDLASPYILLCNYSDCNVKLLMQALHGLQQLLKHELIPSSELQNILRVLTIQVQSPGKSECHVKILQVLAQMVSFLTSSDDNFVQLNEHIIGSLLSVSLVLTEPRNNAAVVSAAVGTSRQIVGSIAEKAASVLKANNPSSSVTFHALLHACFRFLFTEFIALAACSGKQTIKVGSVGLPLCLDILHELLQSWRDFVLTDPDLRLFVLLPSTSVLERLFSSLQVDFVLQSSKAGVPFACAHVNRIVRLSKLLIVDIAQQDWPLIQTLIDSIAAALIPVEVDQITLAGAVKPPRDPVRADEVSVLSKLIPLTNAANALIQKATPGQLRSGDFNSFLHSADADVFSVLEVGEGGATLSRSQSSHVSAACCAILLIILHNLFPVWLQSEEGVAYQLRVVSRMIQDSLELLRSVFGESRNLSVLLRELSDSPLLAVWRESIGRDPVGVFAEKLFTTATAFACLKFSDLFILVLASFRVSVNRLLFFSLRTMSTANSERQQDNKRFLLLFQFTQDLLPHLVCVSEPIRGAVEETVTRALYSLCESASDSVLEAFQHVQHLKLNSFLAKQSVETFVEYLVVQALVGVSSRHLEAGITALCKNAVPIWHGKELLMDNVSSPGSATNKQKSPTLSAAHLSSMQGLIQLCIVLGDVFTDWDIVVDAIDQMHALLHASQISLQSEDRLVVGQREEGRLVLQLLDTFDLVSLRLSNESLVKFMSSFVTQSMNDSDVANGRKLQDSDISFTLQRLMEDWSKAESRQDDFNDNYLREAVSQGIVSLSFKIVIATAKANRYRISMVWQMISSHLRLLCAHRVPVLRKVTMLAMFDLLVSIVADSSSAAGPDRTLPVVSMHSYVESFMDHEALLRSFIVQIVPSSSVLNRGVHFNRSMTSSPPLSQSDLVSSLKVLMSVPHADVRSNLVFGISLLLQHFGHRLHGGEQGAWRTLVDVLASVALSMADASFQSKNGAEDNAYTVLSWPPDSLPPAFQAVRAVADEFLGVLLEDTTLANGVVTALTNFSAQLFDINISLTAIELLWKVSNAVVYSDQRTTAASGSDTSRQIFLHALFRLVQDSRPDVRHCALNTLFSALTSHFDRLALSWQLVFTDFVEPLFPLFEQQIAFSARNPVEHSTDRNNSRGMTHHSRDSASKQWSESLLLCLRGLTKLLRSRIQREEGVDEELRMSLRRSLQLCVRTANAPHVEAEISIACGDLITNIVHLSSEHTSLSHSSVQDVPSVLSDALHALLSLSLNEFQGKREAALKLGAHLQRLLKSEAVDVHGREILMRVMCNLLFPVRETGPYDVADTQQSQQWQGNEDFQLRRIVLEVFTSTLHSEHYNMHSIAFVCDVALRTYPRSIVVDGDTQWQGYAGTQIRQELRSEIARLLSDNAKSKHLKTILASEAVKIVLVWPLQTRFRRNDISGLQSLLSRHSLPLPQISGNLLTPHHVSLSTSPAQSDQMVPSRRWRSFSLSPDLQQVGLGQFDEFLTTEVSTLESWIILLLSPWTEEEMHPFILAKTSEEETGDMIVQTVHSIFQHIYTSSAQVRERLIFTILSSITAGLIVIETADISNIDRSLILTLDAAIDCLCTTLRSTTAPSKSLLFACEVVVKQVLNALMRSPASSFLSGLRQRCVTLLTYFGDHCTLFADLVPPYQSSLDLMAIVERSHARSLSDCDLILRQLLENVSKSNDQVGQKEERQLMNSPFAESTALVRFYDHFLDAALSSSLQEDVKMIVASLMRKLKFRTLIRSAKESEETIAHLQKELKELQDQLMNARLVSGMPF